MKARKYYTYNGDFEGDDLLAQGFKPATFLVPTHLFFIVAVPSLQL